MANAAHDANNVPSLTAITDDSNATITRLVVDPTTKRLKVSAVITSGSITSLNGQTGATQTFADVDDTNVTLTISSAADVHTFTMGWQSTLAVARGGTGTGTAGIGAFNNITGLTAAGTTGTTSTNLVFSTSPTLVTPVLGAATATSINGLTITSSTGTLTITNAKTLSVSDTTTLGTNSITFAGGEVVTFTATNALTFTTTGSTNVTLPTTGTLVSSVTTGNGVSATNTAGALAFTLGAITPTTVNGLTITSTTGTFTLTNGKTLSVAKTLTLDGTDSTTMTFPTTSATIARTDAGQTFTGVQTITNITLPDQGQIKMTVPTTDLTATGPTCGDFNCGYTSSAIGDLVYLDSSSTWQKTDANTLALYNGLLAIALEVKASGNALLVALPGSFIYSTTGFPTWTIGSPIYMSETAGAMTQTQPTTTDAAIRLVGWGVHADKMYFFPSPDYVTHV